MTLKLWRGYKHPKKLGLPDGWSTRQLRDFSEFAGGGRLKLTMSDYQQEGVPACSAEGFNGFVPEAEFERPAVIVSSIGERCGKCFLSETPFTTLANVQVIFPDLDEIDIYFLWSLVNDERFWPRNQTAQPYIRPAEIKKAWIPYPPPEEQQAIGSILRTADEAIARARDELTAARRVKTALMQRVFRRGLEGQGGTQRTKHGPAPADWNPVRVGGVADVSAGVTLNQDRAPSSNPCRYLTVVNVQRGFVSLDEERHLELRPSEIPGKLLEVDDIVVVEGHANTMEIGRAAIIDETCAGFTYQNHLFRVRVKPEADMEPSFLLLALNEQRVRRHWNAICNTSSGLNTLNRRQLRKLTIWAPEGDVQREIIKQVDAADDSIKAIGDKVTALERLKTSLMQNLLTGKVRVKPVTKHLGNGASNG